MRTLIVISSILLFSLSAFSSGNIDYVSNLTTDPTLSYDMQILDLINQHRHKLGLCKLVYNDIIHSQCVNHSSHMANIDQFISHQDVESRKYTIAQNIASYTGENVAMNMSTNPKDVVNQWLNSPGHKANIENPQYNISAVSAMQSSTGNWYYTQMFSKQYESIDILSTLTVNQSLSYEQQIADMINQYRHKSGLHTLTFDNNIYQQCSTHTQNMARSNTFISNRSQAHFNSLGQPRAYQELYIQTIFKSPKEALNSLLASQSYISILSSRQYTHFAISAAQASSGMWYYTLIFIAR